MNEKFTNLVNSYLKWLESTGDEYPEAAKRAAGEYKSHGILDLEYLKSLGDDEYIQLFKNYLSTLSGPAGINFGGSRIINQRSEIIRNIEYLINSEDSPYIKARKILDGEYRLEFAGAAFWTPLFNAVYPAVLPNFNNKTIRFFKTIGVNLAANQATLSKQYLNVANTFTQWIKEYPRLDMYKIDHLMHYGTVVEEGKKLLVELTEDSQVGDRQSKLISLVEKYIEYVQSIGIEKHIENEGYKFEDVKAFRVNFDVEAEDLPGMLERSLPNDNLATSGQYFPRAMLIELAEDYQEEVRQALVMLLDESRSLDSRVKQYATDIENTLNKRNQLTGKPDKSYQDARFISLLLSLMYPDKYVYYKNRQLLNTLRFIESNKASIGGDDVLKIKTAQKLGAEIYATLTENTDYQPIKNAIESKTGKIDHNLWLAQDVYFSIDGLLGDGQMLELIKQFVAQANTGGKLETKKYNIEFEDCKVSASFGMGSDAAVPWMDWVKDGVDKNQTGYQPNLLYYKAANKIILSYGISESHKPANPWPGIEAQTIKAYFGDDYDKYKFRYGTSLVCKVYDADNIPNTIVEDIKNMIDKYKPLVVTNNSEVDYIGTPNNYWIFQGNPKRFDVRKYLSENLNKIATWSANQNSEQMKIGDVVYFWESGSEAGIYGFGIIQSEARERSKEDPEQEFGKKYVDVKVLRTFTDNNYVSRGDFIGNSTLAVTGIIKQSQGSNYLLTKQQAAELIRLFSKGNIVDSWIIAAGENGKLENEMTNHGIISIGWDKLGDLKNYRDKDAIKGALAETYKELGENQYNNGTACYEFGSEMEPGDTVIIKRGTKILSGFGVVTSDYTYDDERSEYKHTRHIAVPISGKWNIGNHSSKGIGNLVTKTLTNLTQYNTPGDEYVNRLLEQMTGNNKEENMTLNIQQQFTLNTILYGPPGTGKTYQAHNVLAQELLSLQADQKRSSDDVLAESLKDLTWWQVAALVLHDINEPVKVSKLFDTDAMQVYSKYVKNRTGTVKQTLWATLQTRSDKESSNSAYRMESTQYFSKNEQSEWSLTEDGRAYVEETLSEINLHPQPEVANDWKKFLQKITFHQSYSYEEFIEGIRPVLDTNESGQISYEIKDGVFKELCNTAKSDPENKYLLVIDEINRGNISKIFGELITLIEEDKRGETVRLPYSQTDFSVPENIYVIGTMNTADRSIALVDIALRRRFNFVEVMPDYSMIEKVVDGVDLAKLLRTVNGRLEIMRDRDHQIGHSYFMGINDVENLHLTWYSKIVPLLLEYFYNDLEKIIEVIGEFKSDNQIGFVHKKTKKDIQILFHQENEYSEAVVGDIHEYNAKELPIALKAIYEKAPRAD